MRLVVPWDLTTGRLSICTCRRRLILCVPGSKPRSRPLLIGSSIVRIFTSVLSDTTLDSSASSGGDASARTGASMALPDPHRLDETPAQHVVDVEFDTVVVLDFGSQYSQ